MRVFGLICVFMFCLGMGLQAAANVQGQRQDWEQSVRLLHFLQNGIRFGRFTLQEQINQFNHQCQWEFAELLCINFATDPETAFLKSVRDYHFTPQLKAIWQEAAEKIGRQESQWQLDILKNCEEQAAVLLAEEQKKAAQLSKMYLQLGALGGMVAVITFI